MITKEQIRTFIARDDLPAALETLTELLKEHGEEELLNEVAAQEGRLRDLEKGALKGIINSDKYILGKNQIRNSLLSILTSVSFLFDQIEKELILEKNLGSLPNNLLPNRVLVFDIDNTVLKKGEHLAQPHLREFLRQLQFFVGKGFHIVFITGNDYSLQRRRVLQPIIDFGLASSVTCFSDGGSRMFTYDGNEYVEDPDYSKENEIDPEILKIVSDEFANTMAEFQKDYQHMALRIPNLNVSVKAKDLFGRPKEALVTVYPLKPSFYNGSFDELKQAIEKQVEERGFESVIRVLDKYTQANALQVEVLGPKAESDVEDLRGVLSGIFAVWEPFMYTSWPELEKRGGGFCSQIAIKPFNIDGLRRKFLGMLKDRLDKYPMADGILVLLGGRTTIDIQKKGVDKRKAIVRLVTKLRLDPSKMIYFGDEFRSHGNDLAVALIEPPEWRPSRIIHVGDKSKTDKQLFNRPTVYIDGNGPEGTFNYLRFLKSELELT